MGDIYRFHDNLKKIMHEDSIDKALEKYENLSEETKALLGIMAFELKEDKNGKMTVDVETEYLERMLMFIRTKKNEDPNIKSINKKETELLEKIMPEKQIKKLFGNLDSKN